MAKNDMISAYQERMKHFEAKLSIKDKEIGLLKETITVFSKTSRYSFANCIIFCPILASRFFCRDTSPQISPNVLDKSCANFVFAESEPQNEITQRVKMMNQKLDSLTNSIEDLREEKA